MLGRSAGLRGAGEFGGWGRRGLRAGRRVRWPLTFHLLRDRLPVLVESGLFDEGSGYAPCFISLHRCNRLNRLTLVCE